MSSACCCSCSWTLRHTSSAMAYTFPILVKRAAILSLRRKPAALRFSMWPRQASIAPESGREERMDWDRGRERKSKIQDYTIKQSSGHICNSLQFCSGHFKAYCFQCTWSFVKYIFVFFKTWCEARWLSRQLPQTERNDAKHKTQLLSATRFTGWCWSCCKYFSRGNRTNNMLVL